VATTTEFKEFERNLEFARRLVSSGRQLEQLEVGSFDVADLYRAAWVQAVAALDHWIHREIYARGARLIGQPVETQPRKLREFKIAIERVHAVRRGETRLEDELEAAMRERLGWVSYQNTDKIKEGLAHVTDARLWPEVAARMGSTTAPGSITERIVRESLAQIAERRNKIVHEADLTEQGRRPVTADEANDVILRVHQTAVAILETLAHDGTPVTGTAYLFTLGHGQGVAWILQNSRAAFPDNERARVDRLVVGDELYLVTTQKCWGDGPDRKPTLVIGSAMITSPTESMNKAPVLSGKRYPRGCALRIQRLARFGEGVDLRSQVPRLDALPNGSEWGRPLRDTLTELSDRDAEVLRAELQGCAEDPADNLRSYPVWMPAQRADEQGRTRRTV